MWDSGPHEAPVTCAVCSLTSAEPVEVAVLAHAMMQAHLPGLCSYEVAGRRERGGGEAAWGLWGSEALTSGLLQPPQVGLAGLCSSSRTGRHTRGGGTLASWWHQSRPACRTRPQAEGLSWGGPSHRSCWEEVAASPPARKAVFLGVAPTPISHTLRPAAGRGCRSLAWKGLATGRSRWSPCWQRVAAGSEGGGRVGSTVEG